MDSNPIHVHSRGKSVASGRPGPICGTQELEIGLTVRVAGDGVSLAEYGSVLGRLAGAHGCYGCCADFKSLQTGFEQLSLFGDADAIEKGSVES